MKFNHRFFGLVTALVMGLSMVLSACQPAAPAKDEVTLKIAVIPVLDTLPMYVAQAEGLFAAHGVKVEFVPVASGAERDQVVSSGQADGMVNEVLSVLFYNKVKTQVQIVRYARTATPENALFRILASSKSGITDVNGLKGVEIGIAQGTVIEYLTERLLQAEGFTPDEIKTVAVPKIPDRLALLNSGELKAAMLPDPTTTVAMNAGAVVVLDDTKHPEYSHSVYSFRKAVIDAHPEAIRGFLAAVEEAVAKINANPTGYNQVLKDHNLVPAALVDTYTCPPFVTQGVPTKAQFDDVLAWAKEKGLLTQDVSYEESVTDAYLPK
ncbi:MAG: ABC transporter substrate-binding protein [Anaerolineaceae bacterium]